MSITRAVATLSATIAFAAVAPHALAAGSAKPLAKPAITAATDVPAVMIARILDKWQPVSSELNEDATVWRAQFTAMLANASVSTLATLDRMDAVVSSKGIRETYGNAMTLLSLDAATAAKSASAKSSGVVEKLGNAQSDLIFVPVPPCRVVDTRVAGGGVTAGNSRQYYFYAGPTQQDSSFSWLSQGGVAGAAISSCPLTALGQIGGTLGAGAPGAAMATVTVVNASAGGNFVAWGGAGSPPASSILNFNAGQVIANTTVIPWGGRGSVKDFAIFYNGPAGGADVVVDVVGYFVENAATALDCTTIPAAGSLLPQPNDTVVNYASCPARYTQSGGYCSGGVGNTQVYLIETGPSGCVFRNLGTSTPSVTATAVCCRVPGI